MRSIGADWRCSNRRSRSTRICAGSSTACSKRWTLRRRNPGRCPRRRPLRRRRRTSSDILRHGISPWRRRCSRQAPIGQAILQAELPAGDIDAELFELFGVIAAEQNVPLLAAFGDIAFLRADLGAGGAIHLVLGHQDFRHQAHDLQTHRVRVLIAQAQFTALTEHLDDLVGNVADLVAREFHGVAGIPAGCLDYSKIYADPNAIDTVYALNTGM